jgi:hypothetical protein
MTCQLLFVFQAPIDVPSWEHKLQYAYCLWFSRRSPGKQASLQNYDQNLKLIGRFASVEQFWALYSHLVRPSDLQSHSDFHLFKVGIKPMWEVSFVLAISSLLSFCKERHAATPVSTLIAVWQVREFVWWELHSLTRFRTLKWCMAIDLQKNIHLW